MRCAQAVDVTDLASAEALARAANDGFGGADVLVNNAAIYAGLQRTGFEFDLRSGMGSRDERQRERHLDHDQSHRAAASRVGAGAIVNVSSATVMSGSPMWLHYVSSKGRDHRHDPGACPRAR